MDQDLIVAPPAYREQPQARYVYYLIIGLLIVQKFGSKHSTALQKFGWLKYLVALPYIAFAFILCCFVFNDFHGLYSNNFFNNIFEDWRYTFAVVSVLFVPVTTGVTCFHVFQHIRNENTSWDGKSHMGFKMSSERVRVTMIVALPMVYSVMALRSIFNMYMMLQLPDESPSGDKCTVGLSQKVTPESQAECPLVLEYEANYDTADLYEAVALFHFSKVILKQIKMTLEGKARRLKVVDDAVESFRAKELSDVHDSFRTVVSSTDSLAMVGVYSFVVTSVLVSAYALFKNVYSLFEHSPLPLVGKIILVVKPALDPKFGNYLYGAGLVTSTLAIYNVVKVEQTFHTLFEEKFKLVWKFVSVKLLVSIVFMQSIALDFMPATIVGNAYQKNLLYSNLIVCELFGIAMLHWKSWPDSEEWLDIARTQESKEEDIAAVVDSGEKEYCLLAD